jgi:hypothetical protein
MRIKADHNFYLFSRSETLCRCHDDRGFLTMKWSHRITQGFSPGWTSPKTASFSEQQSRCPADAIDYRSRKNFAMQ